MKTEIVTFVRAYNYGAVLQCYALSQYLQNKGATVEVLDYFPPYFKQQYGILGKNPIKIGIRPFLQRVLALYARCIARRRSHRFERFIDEYIPLSGMQYSSLEQLSQSPPNCDCYITGSDQVWSPYIAYFDPVFFLDFDDAKEKGRYSYAASFGTGNIPDDMKSEYIRRLSGYKKYSVREAVGAEIMKDLLNETAEVCCDPTFLLDVCDWEKIACPTRKKKPYILIYYVARTQNLQIYAQQLAKEKKMKVVCVAATTAPDVITGRVDWRYGFNIKTACSPQKWLAMFRDAEYVLTNSFHGMVFSILFHKKFLIQTNLNQSQRNERASSLMSALNIYGRELSGDITQIDAPLLWDEIDIKRQELKLSAEKYLAEFAEY